MFTLGQKTGGRPFYTACGWACLYVLAATPAKEVDPPRFALQMVHEWDSCCFQAGNLHANISHYNKFVQSQLTDGESWFQTSANLGNYHEINYRDKVRDPTTWTILQKDGPNHLGLMYNALPGHKNGPDHLGFCAATR